MVREAEAEEESGEEPTPGPVVIYPTTAAAEPIVGMRGAPFGSAPRSPGIAEKLWGYVDVWLAVVFAAMLRNLRSDTLEV